MEAIVVTLESGARVSLKDLIVWGLEAHYGGGVEVEAEALNILEQVADKVGD